MDVMQFSILPKKQVVYFNESQTIFISLHKNNYGLILLSKTIETSMRAVKRNSSNYKMFLLIFEGRYYGNNVFITGLKI